MVPIIISMPKNNIIRVYHNIFLGTYLNSIFIDQIRENDIKCIIFIGSVNKCDNTLDSYVNNNIDHYFINIDENHCILGKILKNAIKLITLNSDKNILIHCANGFSLSIYIIICYYITLLQQKNDINKTDFITVNLLNLMYLKNNRISISDYYIDLLLKKEKSEKK